MARALPEAAVTALTNDYDRLSPDGPEHCEKIFTKLMRMWHEKSDIDPAELAAVGVPTLVMAGDHDGIPSHNPNRQVDPERAAFYRP
jgi:hypothetical protein